MRKLLKFLFITQEKKIPIPTFGEEYSRTKRRLNPFNPLSYVAMVVGLIYGILISFIFGFISVWKEIDLTNPFKWQ